jgi:hypothetical protein
MRKNKTALRILLMLLSFIPHGSKAFGVLTHEAIVDAEWEKSIVPLLKEKFPGSTDSELVAAHAYAYGGAVAPDMGYYPKGSKLFTNLVHYVRSGDMVNALLRNAQTLNQYAFALGFLSHYEADNYGHPLGTNRSVTLVYPKLQNKFGNEATYAEDKIAHVRMEFGFDVLEIAKGNYSSQSYRNYIGFKVDTTVLSKAFTETYGLDINDVFNHHFSGSVETFRWIVANIFPLITRAAWAEKKDFIRAHDSTATSARFRYKMKRRNYNKEYGTGYERPGFSPWLMSLFIRVLPKVGPLRALKFKAPVPQAEKYFDKSFDTTLHFYADDIQNLRVNNITLRDIDFDTGKPTAQSEYTLADATYRDLVLQLKATDFKYCSAALQRNISGFYVIPKAPAVRKHRSKTSAEFSEGLKELRELKL